MCPRGGNKIEILDASRPYASYLYAHWNLIKEGTGPSDGNDPGGAATLVDVKVTASNLNARSGAGTNYKTVKVSGREFIKPGVYTIIEVKEAGGYTWGKLKSSTAKSPRWIALDFTTKK